MRPNTALISRASRCRLRSSNWRLPAENTDEPESRQRWPGGRTNYDDVDFVIVIGTRISGVLGARTEHVARIEGNRIEAYGVETVGELFQYLPQMPLRSVPNGSDARVAETQRGDADSVVLVNGRRPSGAVDVNAIPVVDVQRVEVLLEPASDAADASAVGGIINIVLKDRD